MKLFNIRPIGRYRNKETGQEYNLHKGTRIGRSTTHRFYYRGGKRVFISDADYFHNHKKISE